MTATYKTLAEFAQTWGLALLRRDVRRACSSTRCGRRSKQQFDEAARMPLRED